MPPFEVATKASFRISHPKSDDDDDDDAIQYLTPQLAAASTLRPRRRYIIYKTVVAATAARPTLLSYNAAATDVPRTSLPPDRPVYIYAYGLLPVTRRRPPADTMAFPSPTISFFSPVPSNHIIIIRNNK